MALLTICVPARNELYLNQTIDGIFAAASGEIEVILYLDACWQNPMPADRPNLTIIHCTERRGMRAAINAAAEIGKGKYLMKVDAHSILCDGFDEILQADIEDNWLVTPMRYSLDADKWEKRTDKPPVLHEWLSYPYNENGELVGLHGQYWDRDRDRLMAGVEISENMTFQGSCWFMPMQYFRDLVYPMSSEGYGGFVGEPQQIGLSVWLSGGKQMLTTKAWHSHMWKGRPYREKHMQVMGFSYTRVGHTEFTQGNQYSTDYWFGDKWEGRKHNLAWLVDRFTTPDTPLPTWAKWLEDQRERGLVK